jgi:hypothetical protein
VEVGFFLSDVFSLLREIRFSAHRAVLNDKNKCGGQMLEVVVGVFSVAARN